MLHYADCYKAFNKDAVLWHLKQKGGDEVPSAFEHVQGQDWWSYIKSNATIEETFAKAMKGGDCLGISASILHLMIPCRAGRWHVKIFKFGL